MQGAASTPDVPKPTSAPGLSKQYSCALCHRRKVRCDKKDPCTYCVNHHVPCVAIPSSGTRPRKRRFPEAELLARLKRYETALKNFGVDLEALNNSEDLNLGTETRKDRDPKSAEEDALCLLWDATDVQKESRTVEEVLQEGPHKELDRDGARGEIYGTDHSTMLFDMGGLIDVETFHPAPLQIFTLWQAFLDNVHPILRLFHAPTVQKQIVKAASDPSRVSPALHSFLFAIYSNAAISMGENECLTGLGADKLTIINRYVMASQYALQKARFLQTSALMVLQAFVLYLGSVTKTTDPRSFVSLTAVAERMARRNDLHRSNQDRKLSTLEKELRKRLWWNFVLLDSRAAEMSAVGSSILNFTWKTEFPLNINDSDLSSEMLVLPQGRKVATDMTLCLVRCEVAEFLRQIRATRAMDVKWSEFSNPLIPLEDKLKMINEFDKHIHTKYVDNFDDQNSVHNLARYYLTYSISKMKIAAYGPSATGSEQDNLMQVCLEAIECYNQCDTMPSLERFTWFLTANVPFLAYVTLFFNLRRRPTGKIADRAWEIVGTKVDTSGRERWGWAYNGKPSAPRDSPVQLAFARLLISAWEAREASLGNGYSLSPPFLVSLMRNKLANSEEQQRMLPRTAIGASLIEESFGLQSSVYETSNPTFASPCNTLENSHQSFLPTDDEYNIWGFWNTLLSKDDDDSFEALPTGGISLKFNH